MISAVVDGICRQIKVSFNEEYNIYTELPEKDIKGPCFFVVCTESKQDLFPSARYLKRLQFCIRYIPSDSEKNIECMKIGEELLKYLKYITVDDKLVMGTKMKYKITDDVLHFWVNYDIFTRDVKEETFMEDFTMACRGESNESK